MKKESKIFNAFRYLCLSLVVVIGFIAIVGTGGGGGDSTPPPSPPPTQTDTDGDGVIDDNDQCPNTPPGVVVDEHGCEIDSDGDGVVDSIDQCPNTPPGTEVYEDGCPIIPIIRTLTYDDGLPDGSGYQQIVGDKIAVRFTPSAYPFVLKEISVNIVEWGGDPSDTLILSVYSVGNNGAPGELLADNISISLEASASYLNWNAWIEANIASHSIVIESGDFYVAAEWTVSSSPNIGVDRSSPFDDRTWVFEGGTWQRLSDAYNVEEDAMIRVTGISSTQASMETIAYDDGLPDGSGYQQIVGDKIAVRFTPLAHEFALGIVSVNIVDWGGDPSDTLILSVYSVGNNGAPGELLADNISISLGASASYTNWNAWVQIDLTRHDIVIDAGDFFIAAEWTVSNSPNIGVDRSSPFDDRTWVFEGGTWQRLSDAYNVEEDAMIRINGYRWD